MAGGDGGSRRGWWLLLAIAVPGACAHPGPGSPAPRAAETALIDQAIDQTLEIPSRALHARVRSLTARSPTWRAALDSLRATGFWVVLGTPDDVRRSIPGLERYAARHLGEVMPVRNARGALIGAVVTVDVELIEAVSRRVGLSRDEVEGDLERIIIHEVYGHVLPLALTREIVGGCPDPLPGEPAEASCAIERENRIRAELGMPPRLAYDLRGLAVGRFLMGEGGTTVRAR